MASVINDPNGRRRIQFAAPDGSKKTLRLGKVDRKTADAICRHVEALLASKISSQPIPRETAAWLQGISKTLKDRLAACGLIDAPKRAILKEFLEGIVLDRPDVKPATLEIWKQPCRNLITYFGADRELRTITPGDADQFKAWLLTQGLAPTTLAKRLSFVRTFFHAARKHRLIEENPFAETTIPRAGDSGRQQFVTREILQRLMDVATPAWRTILALSRLGGLRCPSEVLSLRWECIDWEHNRITVIVPKNERYGQGTRIIPLFAELRPYLEEAFELAVPGQERVIGGDYYEKALTPKGWCNVNLRMPLERMLRRLQMPRWPRLFHNLRSSRETELLELFPIQVVSAWMGHDPKIALKHYAQITQDHFDRAIRGPQPDAKSDAKSDANPTQNATPQADVQSCTESHLVTQGVDDCKVMLHGATSCDTVQEYKSEGVGFEHPQFSKLKPHNSPSADAKSDATDLVIAELSTIWHRLNAQQRSRIIALARRMAGE